MLRVVICLSAKELTVRIRFSAKYVHIQRINLGDMLTMEWYTSEKQQLASNYASACTNLKFVKDGVF